MSLISVDILTPAFHFPSTYNRSEILSLCRSNIGTEDLEFIPINNDRIGMIIKDSSTKEFSMRNIEWIYQQNKFLFTQLSKATESLICFQDKITKDQEIIQNLKKEISNLKKIENDYMAKLEKQVQQHRDSEQKADKIILDLQQQLAASINFIKTISIHQPDLFQNIINLFYNNCNNNNNNNNICINNNNNSNNNCNNNNQANSTCTTTTTTTAITTTAQTNPIPVTKTIITDTSNNSTPTSSPYSPPILFNSNSFQNCLQATTSQPQQRSISPTPKTIRIEPPSPLLLTTSLDENQKADLKIRNFINHLVQKSSNHFNNNNNNQQQQQETTSSISKTTKNNKNNDNSKIKDQLLKNFNLLNFNSNSSSNPEYLLHSNTSPNGSGNTTPRNRTLRRRNTIQNIKPLIFQVENKEENDDQNESEPELSMCRHCVCYHFNPKKYAEWVCECGHTSITHLKLDTLNNNKNNQYSNPILK
eukprot:gene2927-3647_t